MRVALNEIRKYVTIPEGVGTDELVKLIGSRLVEVEGTEDWSEKYRGIVIAEVKECEKIPETHLSLCRVDGGEAGAEWADEDGLVQVVCGAPNVHAGMLAVWLRPGCVVPTTWGGENFELSVRKLRGYKSHGMLAAMDELDLGADHDGIIEIEPGTAEPGEDFAAKFGLNDVILDIENKSLTHRPDCFGLIGFAREVAGILGEKFEEPSAMNISSRTASAPLEIRVEDAEICQRYACAVIEMEGATEKAPYLQESDIFLAKAGMRGISRIVDVTNVLMLLTGQPLHAFDYDKFLAVAQQGAAESNEVVVGVRTAREGEELALLDGKTIICDANDILVTAGDVPVALAGAMGGVSTEIDEGTTRVLLEAATFSLYHLRKTQMKHGIFSEAITRFTKGVPMGMAGEVLEAAIGELGGKVVAMADTGEGEDKPEVIRLTVEQVNGLLGTSYTGEEMVKTLKNVGFQVGVDAEGQLKVVAPYWRTDIHIPEDVIEEVGRLRGFDNIPKDSPRRPLIGAERNALVDLKTELRNVLAERFGGHEVLTYSFVSKALQEKVGEDVRESYEIANSISPELQVFRQSLAPGLLEKTYENLKAGYKDFQLFEMNQVTRKALGVDEDGVPQVENHLTVVGVMDFYAMKAVWMGLAREMGWRAKVVSFEKGLPYLEPVRSAKILVEQADGEWEEVGALGELRARVRRNLKLEPVVTVLEVNLDELVVSPRARGAVVKLSKFPAVERDVTVRVPVESEFATFAEVVEGALRAETALTFEVMPLSIYRAQTSDTTKNVSLRLKFASLEKTLTADEISKIMENINQALTAVGAEVI